MNTYVVMSWSPRAGTKCVGVNMNQHSAENLAMHAFEDFRIHPRDPGRSINKTEALRIISQRFYQSSYMFFHCFCINHPRCLSYVPYYNLFSLNMRIISLVRLKLFG